MTRKTNSAQRVYAILRDASNQGNKNQIGNVWAHAFEIPGEQSTSRDLQVAECLRLLHAQFEIVREQAYESPYSKELYEFAFKRIEQVLSISSLTAEWSGLKSHLAPDTLLAINWLSEVLPAEDIALDSKLRDEIAKQLSELTKALEKTELPPKLRSFIAQQVELIEKALMQHGIIGVKALRDALYNGYVSTHEHEAVVSQNEDSAELGKLGNIWTKVKSVPGVVISSNRSLEAGAGIATKASKAIEFIDNFKI